MTFKEYVELSQESAFRLAASGTYTVCGNETNADVCEYFNGELISGNFEPYTTYLWICVRPYESFELPLADCTIYDKVRCFYRFYELEDYD